MKLFSAMARTPPLQGRAKDQMLMAQISSRYALVVSNELSIVHLWQGNLQAGLAVASSVSIEHRLA